MNNILEQLTEKQKKILSWVAFFALIGVGLLLVGPPRSSPQQHSQTEFNQTLVGNGTAEYSYAEQMETRLEEILGRIRGVRNVQVFLTLERGKRLEIAYSVTEEDRSEEKRRTADPTILRVDGGQREIPLILEEKEPEVRGVLVVAEGADDPEIRLQIARAVQTVLQISMYRIEVLPL